MWYRKAQQFVEDFTPGTNPFLRSAPTAEAPAPEYVLPYPQARLIARKLRLSSPQEYINTPALPQGLPRNPEQVYPDFDWMDFLGLNAPKTPRRGIQRVYYTLDEAIEAMRPMAWEHNVRDRKTYEKWFRTHYQRGDKALPSAPQKHYAERWQEIGGWGGFLSRRGKYNQGRDDIVDSETFKAIAKDLGIESSEDYKWLRDIGVIDVPYMPKHPAYFYPDFSEREFFNKETKQKGMTPEEAEAHLKRYQEYARKHNITSRAKWQSMSHAPEDQIALNPTSQLSAALGRPVRWQEITGVKPTSWGRLSVGEELLGQYLREHGLQIKPQFIFPGLKGMGGGLLRYDYAVLNENNQPVMLFEFHGAQHYEPQYHRLLGGDQQFEKQQEHDRIKREYAAQMGVPLIEISYKDIKRIPEIVAEALQQYSPAEQAVLARSIQALIRKAFKRL